jgi:general secretion pathway protein E
MGFLETVLCSETEIARAINEAFEEGPHTAEQILKDIDEEESVKIYAEIEETTDLLEDTSEAPVIQFVNLMLSKAAKNRASDYSYRTLSAGPESAIQDRRAVV